MRREFPTHPIWTDPVFRRDDYQAFAKDVELSPLDVEEPEEVQIRKTLPAIAERLSVLHQSLARDVNDWGVQTKERLDNIETRLGDLFEGRVSMTLNASHRVAAPGGATPASMTTATAFHSIPTSLPATASLFPPRPRRRRRRRRRRRTCSPGRSRPSRSCGGSGRWVWETACPCRGWKTCMGLAGVPPTAKR
jgi:hypothetical protein